MGVKFSRSRKKLRSKFLDDLLTKQANKCFYCECELVRRLQVRLPYSYGKLQGSLLFRDGTVKYTATIDHVVPKSAGGTNAPDNLVACCKPCNQKKGNQLLYG